MNAVLRVLDILRPRPRLIADADTVEEIRRALPLGERVRMMLALSGSRRWRRCLRAFYGCRAGARS